LAEHIILSVKGAIISNALRVRVKPIDWARGRYFALYVNGIYQGNRLAPLVGDLEALFPLEVGGDITAIWVEDAGKWPNFNPAVYHPFHEAVRAEQGTSRRVLMKWKECYRLSTIRGDTQLSSITITGAQRGVNVASIEGMPARGRLSYSIVDVSGTRIVRWHAGSTLVAEGSRSGDGAVTCAAMNGSGLSVACTVTYTADLTPGIAYCDLIWPASYQIHYSTGALSYPRSPEDTVYDTGAVGYVYLTPLLTGSSYNYNVVPVDDNGNEQSGPSAPSDSPLAVNQPPAAPTITGVTGNAAATTVNWTTGESGCTYDIYYSLPGYPINYGDAATPVPLSEGVDATSTTFAAITNYTDEDYGTALTTCKASVDTQIGNVNTGFAAGEGSFLAAFNTGIAGIRTAIDTFETAVGITMDWFRARLALVEDVVLAAEGDVAGLSYALADWQDAMTSAYSQFLAFCGAMLEQNPGRYLLPNGAVPGGAPGGGDGTGDGDDGRAGDWPALTYTMEMIARPLTRKRPVRVVVRATKGGVQEANDEIYEIQYTAAGAIDPARPNVPTIQKLWVTDGLKVNAKIVLFEEDADVAATTADLYVVAVGSSIDLTAAPEATGAFGTAVAGAKIATLDYTVGVAGFYRIAAAARSAAGDRCASYHERVEWISDSGPPAVEGLEAWVIRGAPGNYEG
jgi:hypothetical protein